MMAQKKRIKPRFWLLMMAVMIALFGIVYLAEARYMVNQRAHLAQLSQQRDRIAADNAALERKIAFSKTDEYVERTARSELGLLKPGEVRFVAGAEANSTNVQ